jgi:hypothetical protein
MVQRILGKAKRESYFLSSSLYHVTRRHAMERYFFHEKRGSTAGGYAQFVRKIWHFTRF